MTIDQLKPFCGTDESLPQYAVPFSRLLFTYATDGRVLVRVPRLEYVPDGGLQGIERVMKDIPTDWTGAIAIPEFPPANTKPCELCGSKGKRFCGECEEYHLECCRCSGTGRQPVFTVSEFGEHEQKYQNSYLNLIRTLPNCRALTSAAKNYGPLPFVFDGGDGLLMPCM